MPKVLIVEDNLMIADMTEDALLKAGHEVCGIASTAGEGVALCRLHHPDLALVDLRLGDGELGTEMVARLLPGDKPGILYVTGNISQVVLTTDDGQACLSKPYLVADLLRGLDLVRQIMETGTAAQPFPRGFRVLEAPSAPDLKAVG